MAEESDRQNPEGRGVAAERGGHQERGRQNQEGEGRGTWQHRERQERGRERQKRERGGTTTGRGEKDSTSQGVRAAWDDVRGCGESRGLVAG